MGIRRAIKQSVKNKVLNTVDKARVYSVNTNIEKDLTEKYYAEEEKERPQEHFNKKALEVMERIKNKLNGKDFDENEQLSYTEQVSKLINQATSHENIC